MIELIQFPWSPFCIVQRRILEYSGTRFRIVNIPSEDRSLVWRLTRERYYGVPIVKDGKAVLFETDEHSQVIAKYLDQKLGLHLFPREWEGVQSVLWRTIESDIEGVGFQLNDIYFREFVRRSDIVRFIRHKERKFGRGCLDRWREQQSQLLEQLTQRLIPFEQMLRDHPFLLDAQPRFVDFDLYGMLANFLYSGHYKLPALHTRLKAWYDRVATIQFSPSAREKLRH